MMQRARTSQMNIKSDNVGLVVYQPPGSEKARIATLAVIAAALACGLDLSRAKALVAMAIVDAAEIVEHPGREAQVRARAARAATEMVLAVRAMKRAA